MKLKKIYQFIDEVTRVKVLECYPDKEDFFDIVYEGYLMDIPYWLANDYSIFPKELNRGDKAIYTYYDEDIKDIVVRINVYNKKDYKTE